MSFERRVMQAFRPLMEDQALRLLEFRAGTDKQPQALFQIGQTLVIVWGERRDPVYISREGEAVPKKMVHLNMVLAAATGERPTRFESNGIQEAAKLVARYLPILASGSGKRSISDIIAEGRQLSQKLFCGVSEEEIRVAIESGFRSLFDGKSFQLELEGSHSGAGHLEVKYVLRSEVFSIWLNIHYDRQHVRWSIYNTGSPGQTGDLIDSLAMLTGKHWSEILPGEGFTKRRSMLFAEEVDLVARQVIEHIQRLRTAYSNSNYIETLRKVDEYSDRMDEQDEASRKRGLGFFGRIREALWWI